MTRRLAVVVAVVLVAGLSPAAAGPNGGWVVSRRDDNYHWVEQWTEDGTVAHATNPTGCQWNFDDEVFQTHAGGVLAPGESYSFTECFLSDGVERVNQARASDRRGPLQVTVTVANQYHSRSSTKLGETCVVGPTYPHLNRFDHTNPYGAHVPGSEIDLLHGSFDDGGWAVDRTTVTVTVTNTGPRTAREVGVVSLVGRPYAWLPPVRPPACDGLDVTSEAGFEPRWRS